MNMIGQAAINITEATYWAGFDL